MGVRITCTVPDADRAFSWAEYAGLPPGLWGAAGAYPAACSRLAYLGQGGSPFVIPLCTSYGNCVRWAVARVCEIGEIT